MKKACSHCKIDKPSSDYYRDRNTKDGRLHMCRSCSSARKKQWRKDNPAAARSEQRAANLRRKSLNEEMFAEMWKSQKGRCGICGRELRATRSGHAIDHCHSIGRVRGLLCPNCNLLLGHAKDDSTKLRAAADYLDRHAARTDMPAKPPLKRILPRYESDGISLTAKEWAERSGISHTTIHWRRTHGISLNLPPQRGRGPGGRLERGERNTAVASA